MPSLQLSRTTREILQPQTSVHSWTKVTKCIHTGVIQALKTIASIFSTKSPRSCFGSDLDNSELAKWNCAILMTIQKFDCLG